MQARLILSEIRFHLHKISVDAPGQNTGLMTFNSWQKQTKCSVSKVPKHVYFTFDVGYGLCYELAYLSRHIAIGIGVYRDAEECQR